jgi:hypothetical protein
VAGELRKAITASPRFAISERVYAAAGLAPPAEGRTTLGVAGAPIPAILSAVSPVPPTAETPLGERRAALQRMWGR